jgi:hypothetical protein
MVMIALAGRTPRSIFFVSAASTLGWRSPSRARCRPCTSSPLARHFEQHAEVVVRGAGATSQAGAEVAFHAGGGAASPSALALPAPEIGRRAGGFDLG